MKLSKRKKNRKTKKKMKNKKGGTRSSSSTRRSSHASPHTGSKTSVSEYVAVKKSYRPPRLEPIVEESLRKTLKKEGVHVLSDKMHWIMDLAGAYDVMDEIALTYGGYNTVLNSGLSIPKERAYSETMYYYDGGESGHWIYFDKKGKKWDSYDRNHQKDGKNQFCQTFCLLYMIHDHWKITSGYDDWYKELIEHDYAHNIRVCVKFWRYIFHSATPKFTNILFKELKKINKEFIENNKINTRASDQKALLAENISDIDLALIDEKLDDIDLYAEQIAKDV